MTPKRQRFIDEYLLSLNATDAARKAGYSVRSASTEGERLLRNAEVQAAIADRQAAQLAAADITAERVLRELARLAFVDSRRLYNADGTVKPIQELDADTAAALASFDIVKQNVTAGDGKMDTVIRPRFWDKVRALEALAKRFGLVQDQVRVTVTLEDLVAGSLEREADAEPS